jgi:hypothetical protein
MSPVFDLYGLRHESIDAARTSVERALGTELVAHESSYLGNYFRGDESVGEDLILQPNYHDAERQWVEPAYRDVPYLLYVSSAASPEATRARLDAEPGVSRLRQTSMRQEPDPLS